MKILFNGDRYPYLEMARVGITEDNLDIIIRTDDPGKIPHFHIIDYLTYTQSPCALGEQLFT